MVLYIHHLTITPQQIMGMFGLQCHCVSKVVDVFKACGVDHYCLVLSSVEDNLSTIKFMKYNLYNCLIVLLDLVCLKVLQAQNFPPSTLQSKSGVKRNCVMDNSKDMVPT